MKSRGMIFTIILFAVACIGLLPQVQAVNPPPDGCYPSFTTAEGCNALFSLTTGAGNTGLGWYSLFLNSTANFNTGVGAAAPALTNEDNNTAVCALALFLNADGENNTAVGANALVNNNLGSNNNAIGANALFNNTTASFNNAHGRALLNKVIAEEVAELDPRLVAHGKDGEITTVHYHKVNVMLLNEFLKEHKKVEELQKTLAQQQKGMAVLTGQLKEQAAQIQRVSAQLETSQPATKLVVDEP